MKNGDLFKSKPVLFLFSLLSARLDHQNTEGNKKDLGEERSSKVWIISNHHKQITLDNCARV